jgi:hypothetical protein
LSRHVPKTIRIQQDLAGGLQLDLDRLAIYNERCLRSILYPGCWKLHRTQPPRKGIFPSSEFVFGPLSNMDTGVRHAGTSHPCSDDRVPSTGYTGAGSTENDVGVKCTPVQPAGPPITRLLNKIDIDVRRISGAGSPMQRLNVRLRS